MRATTHLARIALFAAIVFSAGSAGFGQTVAASHTDAPEAHLGKAYADLKSERYDDATREFRAALALDPRLVLRARFPLAVALFQSQKLAEARTEFDAVRSQAGDRPDVMYYLGRLDLMEGNAGAAIRALTTAAASPPFPDTAYYLGSAYLKNGERAPAEKWLTEAATLSPNDPHIQERLAALYRGEGRKDEAQRALALAARLRERDSEVSREKLDCVQKLQSGSLDSARPVCGKLFDPADAGKLTMLGTIYGQHGDYEEALKPLRRAAELSPNSPQMQYNLALDCFQLQRYQEARDALAKVVKVWPDLFPVNALYGAALFQLRDDAPAYEALHHAHELNPQDPETIKMLFETTVSLAEKNLQSEDYKVSARYLSEAARLLPQEPEPHRLLAEVYQATGRQSEAAEEQSQFETLLAEVGANRN